jgi:hypothetical protein
MGKSPTFTLKVPKTVRVETYRVQLDSGAIVTRTADQLAPAPVQS